MKKWRTFHISSFISVKKKKNELVQNCEIDSYLLSIASFFCVLSGEPRRVFDCTVWPCFEENPITACSFKPAKPQLKAVLGTGSGLSAATKALCLLGFAFPFLLGVARRPL